MASFPPIDPSLSRPNHRFPYDREPTRKSRSTLRVLEADDGDHDRKWCWGYTIFRTVYTPESNDAFPKAIERLNTYAKLWADSDILIRWTSEEPKDPRPNADLASRWYNDIIQDRDTLDGVSIDEVGRRFDAWVAENARRPPHQNIRYKACIMIDQESLDQIMMLPENPRPNPDPRVRNNRDPNINNRWVKVVCDWERPDGGRFWFRVGVRRRLFDLCFIRLEERDIMEYGHWDEGDPILNHWGDDIFR
ncbi:hypothetical protein B0I35DRAFT_441471 [Stachybotrys elegans]|uniref:Uncharacterized protein n=1 Tax=Stachybotrys elegans TaxID=80388 RepID=A0A8K0WM81_9HYPO|nr:hypothetical protein B0I35DRAFT_441471 [Stachybotrys elegans]